MDKMDNSNIAAFSSRAAIKQEAGAWIVKMDQRQLTAAEVRQLQQWLATSDFHREYLEKLAHNWDSMAIMQQLAELFPIDGMHATAPSWHQRLRNWLSPSVWAGSALASCALVALFVINQQPSHFETGIGQQASYQLQDGSTISLNTNTEVDIDFSNHRRVVRLIKGEANFDVAKNPQRPFVVYAGEGMVWAVGTAFNVRYQQGSEATSQDNYIDVTVTEGTIKVYTEINATQPPDLSTGLQQSQLTELTKQKAQREALVPAGKSVQYSTVIKAVQPALPQMLESKLAWQQGALIFKGETLEQAIREIARYTDKELVIADAAIKTIRVGGHYKTNNIESLLVSLSQTLGIQFTQKDGQFHLSATADKALKSN